MKIKTFSYPLTRFGKAENDSTEFTCKEEAETEINEFISVKNVIDIKVNTYETRHHNNGGISQLMVLYTVMYE